MYNNSCPIATLNIYNQHYNNIDAKYIDNELHIIGLNEEMTIRLYDLIGREVLKTKQQINGYTKIPMDLHKKQLQFIVIEGNGKRKVLKVIPSSY